MSQNIKCLDPKEEETLLSVLDKRKDAERAYMLYRLTLVTGLRVSEALRLNVEDVFPEDLKRAAELSSEKKKAIQFNE